MWNIFKISASILVSAIVPAILFGGMTFFDQLKYFSGGETIYALRAASTVAAIAFFIALLHAIFLGVPFYFLVKKLNFIRWWMSLIGGFIIGSVPSAVMLFRSLSTPGSSYIENGKTLVANGSITPEGLLQLLYSFTGMGLIGAICGLSAWLLWSYLNNRVKKAPT